MEHRGGLAGAVPTPIEVESHRVIRVLAGPVQLGLELEELVLRDLLARPARSRPPGRRVRRRRLRE